jgi:TRAP-type mannitol/chloroaromatic compound transport system permease small subunit
LAAEADTKPTMTGGPLMRALAAVDAIGVAAGWAAAACLCGLTLLIAGEIGVRFLSGIFPNVPATIPIAWEYSAYLMGNAFMFGSATTLRAGGHIRVGILPQSLPPTALRLLELVATLIGLYACAFLAWSLSEFAWDAFRRGQTSISSASPMWPPKAGIALGAAILTLQMAARLLRVLAGLPPDAPKNIVSAQRE